MTAVRLRVFDSHQLQGIYGCYGCDAEYDEAIRHPEACIEVRFPLVDVKMKEAAN